LNIEQRGGIQILQEWTKQFLIYAVGVAGSSAVILYIQRLFAPPFYGNWPVFIVGIVFWIVSIGVFAWTFRKIVIPAFVKA
jgi:hypothetical protein